MIETGTQREIDVSVVVAVYNTMPYLTACMDSLVGQSIGAQRMEVIAVDDGSTDGSGAELDRFAAEFPRIVRVVHQKNSGGPAHPNNRALDIATGRYVYFIGADDYLGDEALERLVAAADKWGSDVVLGKLEGVDGRYVERGVFKSEDPDISFYDSRLPYAISNTKLFRRAMVEEYRLRFPEDLRIGSDQPFTIEAMVRAKRISVLNDYTYYYAVRRKDASNITYATGYEERLSCTIQIMEFVARLLSAGQHRDAILARHFNSELSKLLREGFLSLSRRDQMHICKRIGGVAEDYFTPEIRDTMKVGARVKLGLAAIGDVDTLCDVISASAAGELPLIVLDGQRIYRAYRGFGTDVIGEEFYEAHKPPRLAEIVERTTIETHGNGNGAVVIEARIPMRQRKGEGFADVIVHPQVRGTDRALKPRMSWHVDPKNQPVAGAPLVTTETGSVVTIRVSAADLIDGSSLRRRRALLSLRFSVGDLVVDLPLPAPTQNTAMKLRLDRTRWTVTMAGNADDQFVVDSEPPKLQWAVAAVWRRVRAPR